MPSLRSLSSVPRSVLLPRVASRAVVCAGACAASLLGGCYSYQPLASTAAQPRAEVRLLFSAEGARQLRDAAGFEMRQLDGVVVRALGDTALLVKPDAIITVDGDELPWRRADLVVPWRTLERSQRRTMDKRRTRGFVAVMGAAFTGVVYFALKAIAGGSGATLQPGSGVPE